MRRICFDISSSYYFHGPSRGGYLNDPSDARDFFEGRTFRFHAATAFDSTARRFRIFTDYKKLFNCLLTADEIITYNGRICDLIVLDKLVGAEKAECLWRKPHHDLIGWGCDWKRKLPEAVKMLLPSKAASWKTLADQRFVMLKGTIHNDFVAGHLAETYRDTWFTRALFRLYEKSGNYSHTFCDDWK